MSRPTRTLPWVLLVMGIICIGAGIFGTYKLYTLVDGWLRNGSVFNCVQNELAKAKKRAATQPEHPLTREGGEIQSTLNGMKSAIWAQVRTQTTLAHILRAPPTRKRDGRPYWAPFRPEEPTPVPEAETSPEPEPEEEPVPEPEPPPTEPLPQDGRFTSKYTHGKTFPCTSDGANAFIDALYTRCSEKTCVCPALRTEIHAVTAHQCDGALRIHPRDWTQIPCTSYRRRKHRPKQDSGEIVFGKQRFPCSGKGLTAFRTYLELSCNDLKDCGSCTGLQQRILASAKTCRLITGDYSLAGISCGL